MHSFCLSVALGSFSNHSRSSIQRKPNKTNKHISSYQRNSFNELKSYYRKRNMEVFGTQKGQDKILCCSILFVSTQPINNVNFLSTPNIK